MSSCYIACAEVLASTLQRNAAHNGIAPLSSDGSLVPNDNSSASSTASAQPPDLKSPHPDAIHPEPGVANVHILLP